MARRLKSASLLWRGLVGAWGALQAQRLTKPSAPSGRSETGLAEQGTLLSCAPFPSSCAPRIPVSGHCLPGAAAVTPVPPPGKPDGRLVLSDRCVFARVVFPCFTIRKLCLSYRQENYQSCCQTS